MRVVDGLLPSGVRVDPANVDIGSLLLQLSNVSSGDSTSDPVPTPMGLLVGGTWGQPSPPDLVAVVAVNTAGGLGLESGDAIALVSDPDGAVCAWRQ